MEIIKWKIENQKIVSEILNFTRPKKFGIFYAKNDAIGILKMTRNC